MRSTPCSTRYVPAGESGWIEPAGEMWSVVTESPSHDEHARALDVADGARLAAHAFEVRRVPHVRRLGLPREELAFRHGQLAPQLVAREDVGVGVGEMLGAHGGGDRVARPPSRSARGRAGRRPRRRGPCRPARSPSRCPCARRANRRRRAAARRGSSPSPRDGCAPRSCGCPRAPSRRRGRLRRSRPTISSASGPELPMHVVQP